VILRLFRCRYVSAVLVNENTDGGCRKDRSANRSVGRETGSILDGEDISLFYDIQTLGGSQPVIVQAASVRNSKRAVA
jgi:hypothetical protein